MALADDELARKDPATGVSFATTPRRARWALAPAPTADGHEVVGTFQFSVAVPVDGTDRRMLAEVLLADRTALRVTDVVAHLAPALAQAAAGTLGAMAVGQALTDAGRAQLASALRTGAARKAFACGVELLGPFELELDSPSWRAERLRATERARSESDATERARHVRRVSELAAAVGNTPPTALLAATAPADRAVTLAAIIARGATESARPLFVVAGPKLLKIAVDREDGRGEPETFALSASANVGALRSVQRLSLAGSSHLVAGGQTGVLVLDEHGTDPVAYRDPDNTSRMGFNAVAYLAATDELWATHSERGVVRWTLGRPDRPSFVGPPAPSDSARAGAQDAVALDAETVAFSSGSTVCVADASFVRAVHRGTGDVVGLVVDGRRLHVIHEDGQWLVLERATWRVMSTQATGGFVTAVAGMPWPGGVRLLLGRRDGAVDCLGVDDALVTRYATRHLGLRALAASAAHVVGMTSDRQRLVLWTSTDGREPLREFHIAAVAGHRVAGICFG